ncbi:MAG: hypothetical protein BroJett030_12970 [Alphaproteobacteria bacterium]|nr:MAG: hypothetical protein BroJett030_12970 [Alphaproteobacteria bacterium]
MPSADAPPSGSPLQNRVAPDGSLHADPARGMFTGNRGIIHDPATRALTGRRWTTRAWIVCACAWRGRRREVWGRNGPGGGAGWTELFFLDEVTALAAGHRPCFHCRREAAVAFAAAFATGNGMANAHAPRIDAILHAERWLSAGRPSPRRAAGALAALPDGALVSAGVAYFALRAGHALAWTFAGYRRSIPLAALEAMPVTLVTPPATVAALAAGYRPVWHESGSPARLDHGSQSL